jgi:hypothetical protein
MNSTPIEFHRIWIDQGAATEGIRERFGLTDALNYLIGEKLFSFLHAAERDPLFAAEVPAFIGEIRRLFTSQEIRDYLDHLERLRYLAPQEVDLEPEPDEDLEEEEDWLENSAMGAEELLRFARVRLSVNSCSHREPWQNQSAIPSARSASMRKSSWMPMGPRSRPWAGTTIWKTRSASRSRRSALFPK